MTAALDPVVTIGAARIAAIVERSIGSQRAGGVFAWGAKRPLAILIRHNGVTTAFDTDGEPIALADVDRRFAGLRARFERLAEGMP